jgi:hypothetical protein
VNQDSLGAALVRLACWRKEGGDVDGASALFKGPDGRRTGYSHEEHLAGVSTCLIS